MHMGAGPAVIRYRHAAAKNRATATFRALGGNEVSERQPGNQKPKNESAKTDRDEIVPDCFEPHANHDYKQRENKRSTHLRSERQG